MAASNKEIYTELLVRLTEAEAKHPLFAEGPYQALGYIGEEYSEVVRALTKNEGDARFRDELFDLIIVAWRTLRGDHIQGEEGSDGGV